MDILEVKITQPGECNVILGQSHFIKTVEDLYEVVVNAHASIEFGLAFCEASGPCLIRSTGNSAELEKGAVKIAEEVGCGHFFVIVLKNAFPINVLNEVKMCREVCRIYCATANPVTVVVAENAQGRGVMGVIDGAAPAGSETDEDRAARRDLLRRFGYKK